MSATGLEVFDKTLQTTHIWLDDITDRIGEDRHAAWRALGVVLRTLRNRLPVELAAHLGAQLPLLIRGAYYDQFTPERQPSDCDTPEQFRAEVGKELGEQVDADEAITAVFATLDRHLSEGLIAKVRAALPRAIAMAWDGADNRQLTEAGA